MSTSCFNIFSVNVSGYRAPQLISHIQDAISSNQGLKLAFANSNLLNLARRDPNFRQLLEGFLVVNDGIGVDLANLLINGHRFPENLNGTDFTPRLLQALPAGTRVALVGATEEVNHKACLELRNRFARINIVYSRNGFFQDTGAREACMTELQLSQPDIVLVAMGNPLQERFMADLEQRCPTLVSIGVGAFFDFVSGLTLRAPPYVRQVRMEWLYRLCREPRRLGRRYTLDAFMFLYSALRIRLSSEDRT